MSGSANPYVNWVAAFDAWSKAGSALPLGGVARPPLPPVSESAPAVLLFSPHPDDECVTGTLPLRLAREAGLRVVNVAVTLGSNKARQAARWEELQQACAYLDWPVECPVPGGLERISPKARQEEPAHWREAVAAVRDVVERHRPLLVFYPHAADWNGTHIGTHWLVEDALAGLPQGFVCGVVETEFWGAMPDPNLMVEAGVEEVAELVAATGFHVGEVRRNPYHLALPAWMQDNVRRGGEVVGGQGGAAPSYRFATLYRAGLWRDGARREPPQGTPRFLPLGGGTAKQWTEAIAWK